jgi:CubicO group peptidase (beta-lactamase class C family)
MVGLGVSAIVSMTLGTAAWSAPINLDAATIAALDAAVQQGVREGNTVGVAVGIMSEGKLIFASNHGFGNLETRTPVTPDTVFRIASVTKQFTAASILLLSERRQLSLDDRLSKFLPAFPNAHRVTIRQLLNHTAGLKDYAGVPEYWMSRSLRETSTEEFVQFIAGLSPQFDFEPGTGYNYSNSGYYLLGAVIEKVTGKPYGDFYKTELFDKAGMTNTAVDASSDIVPNRASGYERDQTSKAMRNAPHIAMSTVGANGSLRSTVNDLLRWNEALLGGRILRRESLKAMLSPGRLSNGAISSSAPGGKAPAAQPGAKAPKEPEFDYGYGMNLGQQQTFRTVWHEGGIHGFRSSVASFPDQKLSIVFLTNTGAGVANVPKAVTEIILKHLRPTR